MCPRHVLCPVKNMPTCFLPLQTSGHDLGTVADGCDGPVDKQRSALEEESEARCGWCFFRPEFLQRFRTAKWVLFWLCWAGAVQGRKESFPYYYYYYYYYLLTYLLTPWSRVLLEKLTGSAASQEILRIFGTRMFLTVPTSAHHLSLS